MARKGGKKSGTSRADKPVPVRPEPGWSEALERRGFWVALGALALLLVVFFNPVFFAGQEFQDADNLASLAHRPFVEEAFHSSGSLLERYPLWTPYVFSGMPSWLIAAPYTSLRSILMAPIPGVFKVLCYYLILGIFTWLLLRRHGAGTLAALLGSAAYVFSAHVITLVMFGHNSKVATLMFMPLVLLATDEVWRRFSLRWISLLALAIGLLIGSTHFQIAYYTLLAGGLYLLVMTVAGIRDRTPVFRMVRAWVAWVVALGVGIGAAAVVFLPAREYAEHSIRGGTGGGLPYDYATNWSLHPLEMTTFFTPSFMGFGLNTYWGWMPFTHFPHYMGILVLFLAVLTVSLWPRERFHLYLTILAVLALILSFGRHFPLLYDPMFNYFPNFSKFRVPSMILVLFQFAVAVLAALGAARLVNLPAGDRARVLRRVWTVGGGFLAVVLVLGGLMISGSLDGALQARFTERAPLLGLDASQAGRYAAQYAPQVVEMVQRDTLVAVLVMGLGIAILWARLRERITATWALIGLLVLAVGDLWNVDHRPATYSPRRDRDTLIPLTDGVRYLKDDPEPYRILPLTGQGPQNNNYAYFKISSILGYHPAKLQIYQDLIDEQGPVGILNTLRNGNFNVVDMLNMKYILAEQEIGIPPLRTVHRGNEFVMLNEGHLPRMWFVDGARVVEDPEAHLRALADTSWTPRTEALLFEEVGPIDPGTGGTARITGYEPREIRAELNSPGNCFLVISEVYYQPGWTALLDGEGVDIHRVNYVLKGIRVPEGRHELVLRFDPPVFLRSVQVSLASHGLIALGLLVSFVAGRRRKAPAHPDDRETGEEG